MILIAITPPGNVSGEHEVLNDLFTEGLEILHVRKPGWSCPALEGWLSLVPHEFLGRVVLHSHYALAEKLPCRGIHVKPGGHDSFISGPLAKSCSLHSLEEAASLTGQYDYAFLSPVFDSISKPGYKAAFSLKDLKIILRQKAERKNGPGLIALGGICPENLLQAAELGFQGAAVLGALWKNGGNDAAKTFCRMKEVLCSAPVS